MTISCPLPDEGLCEVWFEDWLGQFLSTREITLVADHPWAKTYRIRAAEGIHYLKVLPEMQRSALPAMPLLSHYFSPRVPKTLAVDVGRGLLLLRDHGGRDVGGTSDDRQPFELLETYAEIQGEAARIPELLDQFPALDLAKIGGFFSEFLRPGCALPGNVGAEHFLGTDRAAYYSERFSNRLPRLHSLILEANRLPRTINHCDLRPRNSAIAEDASCIIFDWDEAVAGPAGMSLHNFFSGCSATAEILHGGIREVPHQPTSKERLLETYLQVLAAHEYAPYEVLRDALPGAVCAGVMLYLMSYGKFPMPEADDRRQVGEILLRRLDDLLKLCDFLALSDRMLVAQDVKDYQSGGALKSARSLLERYLSTVRQDWELQGRLGGVLRDLGDLEAAEAHCRRILETQPTCPEIRDLLGQVLGDRLNLDEAVDQLQVAAAFAPESISIRLHLEETTKLRELDREASRPGCVPRISCTDDELRRGAMPASKRRLARRLFREHGLLLLENVIPANLLDEMYEDFHARYRSYLGGDRHDDALRVGDRRFMISVAVEGIFNAPALYAPPLLTPILAGLLADEFILGSFTAVTSLPGAKDMRMHKDHPALFEDRQLAYSLPTFAITTLIPLRGFDLTMGTTRVVRGSHRCSSSAAAELEYQDPVAPQGSCLLMDYRLSHQGLANRSEFVRPVISLVYSRPWFRDSVNFDRQDPLCISREEFQRVPESSKKLFGWKRL